MKKYRVLQRSFIDNQIVEEGAIVHYDGEPGANLQAVDAEEAEPKGKAKGKGKGKADEVSDIA